MKNKCEINSFIFISEYFSKIFFAYRQMTSILGFTSGKLVRLPPLTHMKTHTHTHIIGLMSKIYVARTVNRYFFIL